jgi:phage anti-repressor protein
VTFFNSPNPASLSSNGGRGHTIDYALTIDMAKELAMVERNAKARRLASISSNANAT